MIVQMTQRGLRALGGRVKHWDHRQNAGVIGATRDDVTNNSSGETWRFTKDQQRP